MLLHRKSVLLAVLDLAFLVFLSSDEVYMGGSETAASNGKQQAIDKRTKPVYAMFNKFLLLISIPLIGHMKKFRFTFDFSYIHTKSHSVGLRQDTGVHTI